MKHRFLSLGVLMTIIFTMPALLAKESPNLQLRAAAGVLEKISVEKNDGGTESLSYRCVPPSGDVYVITLNAARSMMTVERKDLWLVEGSPVHSHEFQEQIDHYYFSNGYAMHHYDFSLTVPRDQAKPTEFHLAKGGIALHCQSQP